MYTSATYPIYNHHDTQSNGTSDKEFGLGKVELDLAAILFFDHDQ